MTEDRNEFTDPDVVYETQRWRSPSGVTEDRNSARPAPWGRERVWRSPSGVTEDRNAATTAIESDAGHGGGRPPG